MATVPGFPGAADDLSFPTTRCPLIPESRMRPEESRFVSCCYVTDVQSGRAALCGRRLRYILETVYWFVIFDCRRWGGLLLILLGRFRPEKIYNTSALLRGTKPKSFSEGDIPPQSSFTDFLFSADIKPTVYWRPFILHLFRNSIEKYPRGTVALLI